MSKSFYESVKHSTQESHVQEAYNNAFKSFFNVPVIERKHQCDGYFETKTSDNKEISVLIEYKYDIHMKDRVQRSKVIAQCLGYLKQFEQSGEKLPKLVFIGDINECCIIHTNDLLKLLDLENVDWSVAPSSMGDKNIDLVFNIAKDISPWVYDVNESFTFKDVADKITDLCNNVSRKLHITEKNIEKVYNLFCDRVIKDKKKVQANDLVSTFIGTMLDSEHYYQHPRKKNILVANDKQVAINGDQFELFMQMHSTEYSPKEKRIMTAISDRLIEDTNRRNKGEFYTPTLFVDYAHKMIEKELGSHWKDNYVVWDPAAGTLNLTRDYRFKDLYCSTLEQAELDISKNYNKEATKFQFDFLNDSLDDLKVKAPGLLEAFELNKPIVFFLNPPYACNGAMMGEGKGNSNTLTKSLMQELDLDGSKEIFNQFLFRILKIKIDYKLTNVNICLICKPSFISKRSYYKFRNSLLSNFTFVNGIYFQASHFANVSSNWGITFNIWKTGESVDKNNFVHKLVDVSESGELYEFGEKNIYNIDGLLDINSWLYSKTNGKPKRVVQWVGFRSTPYKLESSSSAKITDDTLAIIANTLTCINLSNVFYVGNNGGRYLITKQNLYEACAHFVARTNIENYWYNDKDEFLAPNETNFKYKEFLLDSLVISMFESQVSLRNTECANKTFDIANEFFWMSKQEMLDLAEKYNNDYTYEDALNSDERFVYLKLQEIKDDLSPEAKAVLDKATDLVKKSFKYREMFNESHPEYQINNWDCGFYQIKALLKEFMPDELKEFRTIYKQLADKMRPMVYELGFLKK